MVRNGSKLGLTKNKQYQTSLICYWDCGSGICCGLGVSWFQMKNTKLYPGCSGSFLKDKIGWRMYFLSNITLIEFFCNRIQSRVLWLYISWTPHWDIRKLWNEHFLPFVLLTKVFCALSATHVELYAWA